MQFHKDSPVKGYSVLHLLSCSFAKIHQRDIVSCICYHDQGCHLLRFEDSQRDIVSRICCHVVSQRFTRGIQCLASVIMNYHKDSPGGYIVLHLLSCSFTKIHQKDIVSCICQHVVSQIFTRGKQCLASVVMQFHKDSPEGCGVLHLLSCSFTRIHPRDIVSCICYHVVSQRFSKGIQCLASVIVQFRKDSPEGYSVLYLLSCSFAKIHQRDIVSRICYHVVSQRFNRGIQCLASVIMQFHKYSPEGCSVLHLLSWGFTKIHQRDIMSCIYYHVLPQRFTRGIYCLASVIVQFHEYSPEGYGVLHLLSCSFTKIHQRDIVSCTCSHVVSQRFTRGIQCLASVFMQFHKYSPEGFNVLHLLSCNITKIHQEDILSCICQRVLPQRFSWGIYCLASVSVQFHNDSPEGYSVLHLLSCIITKILLGDILSRICYRVVSQRFTRGMQCVASVIIQFHKDSPEGYCVLHLLACSFTNILQREIVSCICYHVVSQGFIRGIQCLASVSMQFHKYSPEGYSVLHVLSWGFTKIDQRDIVSCIYYHVFSQRFTRGEILSCICYRVVSQRFTRGIQCPASVIMQFHKDSPEVYSVLHLLSCSFATIHQRDIVSCICYHVVSQRFSKGIQCLASVIVYSKIIQRDIVSCICYHVVSQRFSRGIQCLASVIMQFREDSPEEYSGSHLLSCRDVVSCICFASQRFTRGIHRVLHLLSCIFTKIHQRDIVSCCYLFTKIHHVVSQRFTRRDIVSCICYRVVSQRLSRGIQCLASVIMQFHKDSPEGYSVSCLASVIMLVASQEIHQRDIVSCICQHVVSQIFPRGMQCLASVIIWLRKDSPEGYSVQHLLSCSFTNIHQRDIVSCICYHVVSQRFTRGIQCLASVIMQFRRDSPEGYSVLHLLACSIQRDVVSCICYHLVSQRFTRGIQCLASVIMYYHKDSPEGYSVLHLLSCSFTKIHQRIQCLASVFMQFHNDSPEGYSVLHLLS